ncbi:hypothetical protein PR048_018943 [Dryococelus australis]|uniref:MADF domain-containing protein n=1 Tax=Dryococelus australis TaxID=614101 RepID=A0ABQ9H259_9NEOP|nr:hypothetical protein PR048_018943 [Dryococelus australis]
MENFSEKQLIYKVKRYSELYDIRSRDFKNKPKKDKAWIEIADQFQEESVDASFCKIKWRHLRDSYLRERRVMKTSSVPGAKSKKKWKHTDTMRFLDDTLDDTLALVQVKTEHVPRHEGESSGMAKENADSLADEALQHPLVLMDCGSSTSANSGSASPSTVSSVLCASSGGKKRKQSSKITPPNKFEQFIVKELSKPKDDIELFCASLGASLRKLPSKIVRATKIRLLQVMVEAEEEAEEMNMM